MIWLYKTKKRTITDGNKNSYAFLKDLMESAEKYVKRIKRIKHKKLTTDIKTDAEYHLYQLMEIYVDCKIVEKWLSLPSDSEKIDFFFHFDDEAYLKKTCNFLDSYCSRFEYASFSDLMKKRICELFDEYIGDFRTAFLPGTEEIARPENPEDTPSYATILSFTSFYINQGLWTALRLIPANLCPVEKILFQNVECFNYDFISNRLLTFDKKFNLEPVFDNLAFYRASAEEAFLSLLDLARYLYDFELINRIDTLETDVAFLKRQNGEILFNLNNMYTLVADLKDKINPTKKNGRLVYYQTCNQEDLIKKFHAVYQVPENFFEILQIYPFEDKIILSKEFRITDGFQALIITYLDYCVQEGKKDMALLKVLFHIAAKNPAVAKNGYTKRLDNFKDFIKQHADGAFSPHIPTNS